MPRVFRQVRAAVSERLPLLTAVAAGLALVVVLAMTLGTLVALTTGVVSTLAVAGLMIAVGNTRPAPVPVRVRRD